MLKSLVYHQRLQKLHEKNGDKKHGQTSDYNSWQFQNPLVNHKDEETLTGQTGP